MHLKRGIVNIVARTGIPVKELVIAQHMTDVLTEIAFDALAEFLHAINVRHVPSGISGLRGLKGLMPFLIWKFQETSVTRSLMRGKACIGSTVIGLWSGGELSRVIPILGMTWEY
jgi:hypothetical protein